MASEWAVWCWGHTHWLCPKLCTTSIHSLQFRPCHKLWKLQTCPSKAAAAAHTILRGMCWITARDTMIWDFKFMSVIASTCLTTSVVTSNFWQISWQLAWFRTRTLSFESFPSSKGMPVNNHSLTWRARYKDKVKQEQLCSEPSQLSSNSAGSSRSYYHISLKYRVSGKDGCPWLKINFLATN